MNPVTNITINTLFENPMFKSFPEEAAAEVIDNEADLITEAAKIAAEEFAGSPADVELWEKIFLAMKKVEEEKIERSKSFFYAYGVTGTQVVVGAVAVAIAAAGIAALSRTEFAQNLASNLRFKFWVNLQRAQANLQGINKSPEEIANLSSIKRLANEVLKLEEQKKALLEQAASLKGQKDAISAMNTSEEIDTALAEVQKELQAVDNRLVYIRA